MNTPLQSRILSHSFFNGMTDKHISIIMQGASEKNFDAGALLCAQGAPANAFFLIEQGSVLLDTHESGETAPIQTVHAGDVVGWSWLFPPFTWHLSAHAVEPTHAIVLSGAHLLAVAEANHEFGYELMKRVAQVLVQRIQSTGKELLEAQKEPAICQ